MLDVLIALAEDFDDKLIQRVVVAFSQLEGIPCITTLYLPLQTDILGLLAVGFLFSGILHLEQEPLLLECQNRRTLLISHLLVAKVYIFLDINT